MATDDRSGRLIALRSKISLCRRALTTEADDRILDILDGLITALLRPQREENTEEGPTRRVEMIEVVDPVTRERRFEENKEEEDDPRNRPTSDV